MKTVLITGGAGSLGKEFVRLLHESYKVYVVDNSEWALAELQHEFPDIVTILDDFSSVSATAPIDYVIHCAAYKHVNIGEDNVSSFIENNLVKTIKFYERMYPAKILYISTDKAVEPISAYGATKMLAERLTTQQGGAVARCGNFLGSSGSVVPLWEKQIKEKTPVTLTDPNMIRYVCDTAESAREIWERFLGGEQLIIPQNRRLTLIEFITEIFQKHGYPGYEDYKPGIKIIGVRPGEKMEEKLKWEWEVKEAHEITK